MATLDSLPADQRAVLQLILQRGRGYDAIAAMLSIDRAAGRQRALDAFDKLGPPNAIPTLQRSLFTDYLLGQLPPKVAEQVYAQLGRSPSDRAWAEAVAAELAGLTSTPLPEIPDSFGQLESVRAVSPPAEELEPVPAEDHVDEAAYGAAPYEAESYRTGTEAPAEPLVTAPPVAEPVAERRPRRRPSELELGGMGGVGSPVTPGMARSSRRGGAILLALVGVLIIAGVVIALVVNSGGNSNKPKQHTTAGTPATTTATTPAATRLATLTLTSPTGAKQTVGEADVIRDGATLGIVIAAQGLPANTLHNAYAVWLYNSPSSATRVGFVDTRVTKAGKLETEGQLPANAGSYKQVLLTLETQVDPKQPGTIVLRGAFKLS